MEQGHPNYFVETKDGQLAGYWNPMILKCDLIEHKNAGEAAVRVFVKVPSLGLVYEPADDFDAHLESGKQALANLCERHRRVALQLPETNVSDGSCTECVKGTD